MNNETLFNELMKTAAQLHRPHHIHPHGRPECRGKADTDANANVNVTVTVNVNGENVNAGNAGKNASFGCGKGDGWKKHEHFGAGSGARILDLIPEDGGISQQALAENLRIRPQSVSEAVAKLEERGLVRREENSDDRRVTLIFVTEKGAQLRSFFREERKAYTEHFFAALTEDEKDTLFALLSKLNEAHFKEFAQHAHCRCKKHEGKEPEAE